MQKETTSEYLSDDAWYAGRLDAVAAIPGGEDEDLGQFEAKIQDAYRLLVAAIEGSDPRS
ncbi:MAG: hypothetical protein H7X91_03405 [Burkholderiales bacterium]|nr:hypothetical protein [Burkholderiales bacterium]